MDIESQKLARECFGCARARDFVCHAISKPRAMWIENESCFAWTTDQDWFRKYDDAVKEYKLTHCWGITQNRQAG